MDLGLQGKVALVTGASQGLGFAIASELSREGASVVLCARNEGRLKEACATLRNATYVVGDLSHPGEARRVVENVVHQHGHIDIVVANTGGPPKGRFTEVSNNDWNAGFQGLWMSAVESIQAALPSMQKRQWGRILLVTSVAAKEPMSALTISNGLRAGLTGLAKSLANEVAADGITVNVLLPGYTRTERLLQLGIAEDKISASIPAARLGEPDELAALATFLASKRAAYITGQGIAVDGGWLKGH